MTSIEISRLDGVLRRAKALSHTILTECEERSKSDLGLSTRTCNFEVGRLAAQLGSSPRESYGYDIITVEVDGYILRLIDELRLVSSGDPSIVLRDRGDEEVVTIIFDPSQEDAEFFEVQMQYALDLSIIPNPPGLYASFFDRLYATIKSFNGIICPG